VPRSCHIHSSEDLYKARAQAGASANLTHGHLAARDPRTFHLYYTERTFTTCQGPSRCEVFADEWTTKHTDCNRSGCGDVLTG
jgi:hypothetical protein